MDKRKQVPSRQYTDEFKVEAVRLAESIGANQTAKRLGIPDSSLWNWLRLSRAGKLKVMRGTSTQVKPGVGEMEAENERLRRELANVKMDLEIVNKRRRSAQLILRSRATFGPTPRRRVDQRVFDDLTTVDGVAERALIQSLH